MITAFTVKNFKAIGDDPVRIELKPITLLFGANSAGKSSILHALNYAYSVFIDRNLNAEYNAHSDTSFNLGRFDRFVHNNSKSRSIVLRFDLNFQAEADIAENILINWSDDSFGGHDLYEIIPEIDPRKILSNVKTAYIEVEISWSHIQKHPYVLRYETGLDDERIADIYADYAGDNRKKNMVLHFNKAHTIYKNFFAVIAKKDKFGLNWLENYEFSMSSCGNNINISLKNQKDALPNFKKILILEGNNLRDFYSFKTSQSTVDCDVFSDNDEFSRIYFDTTKVAFNDLLTSTLIAPGNKVADWLKDIRYLGPLREIPSRHFLGEISKDNFEGTKWRWEKGIGAWDVLYRIGQSQLDLSQKPHKDIHSWLKENFEKYHMKIWDSVLSDPKYKADFYKYCDDLPDATLFIKAPSQKSNEDIFTWLMENFEKYLSGLPADVLVGLNLPRKSSSLREDADRLLYRINDWLASDQRLNTGYKVFIERFREISSVIFKDFDEQQMSQENMSALLKKILNEPEIIRIWLHDISRSINLKPHEIGTGISQVLPVVVAAVGVDAPLVAIEQPELHIHPAMQVQLGDLFITQSSDKKFFLIETHSEHLLLRILRRIRETTEEQASDEVKILPNQVAIYYVESENGSTQANHIGLDKNGRFTDRWPRGFFEEREKEYFGEQQDLSDELGRLFGK